MWNATVPLDEARPDAELLEAVRRGVIAAYGPLYERHAAAARKHAQRLARCDADVDDLVAESFAKVLSALRAGRGPSNAFRAYLLTALRHVAYDRTRREKYLDLVDNVANVCELSVPFVNAALIAEEREFVAKAMTSLPERWRKVLYYTEIEGLSPPEVAPRMKIENANSVAALAYRARAGLRVAYLQAQTADCARRTCRDIRPKLAAWLRHGLSKRAQAIVDVHLDHCRHCRRQADNLADLNVNLPA